MSFFTSITGFAGVLPAAAPVLKGIGPTDPSGVEIQQLLPSGADFAALVRALTPGSNAYSDGNPPPQDPYFEPLQKLEEALQRFFGVPVTVEPVAAVEDWGLFEIRIETGNEGKAEEGSGESGEEIAAPGVAFLLTQLVPAGDAHLPSYPIVKDFGQGQVQEGVANPHPVAFLIYPAEGEVKFDTESAPIPPLSTNGPLPEPLTDPVQPESLLHAAPQILTHLPTLTSLRVQRLSVDLTSAPVTGPPSSSAVPSDQATVSVSVVDSSTSLPLDPVDTDGRLPAASNVEPISLSTESFPPKKTVVVQSSEGLPETPQTFVSSAKSPELLVPSTPTLGNSVPSNRHDEPVADKPGLAEVAKTLRLVGQSTPSEPQSYKTDVPLELRIPEKILEILGDSFASLGPESGQTEGQPKLPIASYPAAVVDTSVAPPREKPDLYVGTSPREPLSVPLPQASEKLANALLRTDKIALPVKILEGEPALKIVALAAKVLAPLSDAPVAPTQSAPTAPANDLPVQEKGPSPAAIKPLVQEKPALLNKELPSLPIPKPDVRTNVQVHPALSSETAGAMIEESEQGVARSILSTFFSSRVNSPSRSIEPKTPQSNDKTKQVSIEKPALNLAPKASAVPAPNPRRLAPTPVDRLEPVGERQSETSIRTASVSGQSAQVSPATPSTTAASSTGSSSSSTNVQNLEVVEQVSQALRSNRGPLGSEIRIRLVPENLGEVHLKISMKAGTLVAEIRASSEVTREILSREAGKIQALLGEHGPKVEHVVIRTGGFGGEAFEANRSTQREPNLPAEKDNSRHAGRDARDSGSSQKEKERDPHSPWERWEKFA